MAGEELRGVDPRLVVLDRLAALGHVRRAQKTLGRRS
jgi:hypothetical protein